MEPEEPPLLINSESDYSILSVNNNRSMSSDANSLLLPSSMPLDSGLWIYSQYSYNTIKLYRFLHLFGVVAEALCFLLCESLTKFDKGYYKNTPFCVDPIFTSILWGVVIFLGCCFLYIIFKPTPLSVTILADKLRTYYFFVYISVAIFFIFTNVVQGVVANIITDLCAIFIFGIMLYSYLIIKYEDDGRYIVKWVDYLGVQVHFSVLLAWSLMMICEYFFRTLSGLLGPDDKNSKVLGWDHEIWTLIVMIINFMVATFWLHRYKDIYFANVLAYTFFGIFSMQIRVTCIDDPDFCSYAVKVASVSLASILLFFVFLTFLFYPKLVLYNVRVDS